MHVLHEVLADYEVEGAVGPGKVERGSLNNGSYGVGDCPLRKVDALGLNAMIAKGFDQMTRRAADVENLAGRVATQDLLREVDKVSLGTVQLKGVADIRRAAPSFREVALVVEIARASSCDYLLSARNPPHLDEGRNLPDSLCLRKCRDVVPQPRIVWDRFDAELIAVPPEDGVEDCQSISTRLSVREFLVREVLARSLDCSLAGPATNRAHRPQLSSAITGRPPAVPRGQ